MQTFTIGLGHRWWIQVFGRNPLVRPSDRIEVLVLSFAVLVTVVAIPVAAAIGTSVHDARACVYAEEALTRHQVTATAIEDGVVVVQPPDISFTARARWTASGREDSGVVEWLGRAKIGDQQAIWVNDAGENVGPPTSPSRADGDAVAIAILVWFGVAGASAGLVYVVRRWLDRCRYAQWDRAINGSGDNNGRRNHQS
jgi:hypothetical protein